MLPCLDGIEFYHALPFSPELGSAQLSGRVDYARLLDPIPQQRVKRTPGMSGTDFYQSVIQATWVTARKKPLDDPRVRRAMHPVLDKAVLVEVVKDVAPMHGRRLHLPLLRICRPARGAVRPARLPGRPGGGDPRGTRIDGGGIRGLGFVIRDVATFKLWAPAIQAMMQQRLNIECRLRAVVESVWFDDVRSGNVGLPTGADVSTLVDPSDYFNAWYKDGGSQNYWCCRSPGRRSTMAGMIM